MNLFMCTFRRGAYALGITALILAGAPPALASNTAGSVETALQMPGSSLESPVRGSAMLVDNQTGAQVTVPVTIQTSTRKPAPGMLTAADDVEVGTVAVSAYLPSSVIPDGGWDETFSVYTNVYADYHKDSSGNYYLDQVRGDWSLSDPTVSVSNAYLHAGCFSGPPNPTCSHDTMYNIGYPTFNYQYSYQPPWRTNPANPCAMFCFLAGQTDITLHHGSSSWVLWVNACVFGNCANP